MRRARSPTYSTKAHEREGAYDFLGNDAIPASAIAEMLFAASVAQSKDDRFAFAVVDGSALPFTDRNESKDIDPERAGHERGASEARH